MRPARVAWLVAGVLLAVGLVIGLNVVHFALVGHQMGYGIWLIALAVGAAGVALALSIRRAWIRPVVSVAAGLVIVFLAWVGFVFATTPDYDAVRTIEFTRLPDETNATTLDPSFVPAALRAGLAKWNVTDHSSTNVPTPEATRFWDAAAARTGYQVDGHRGYVLRIDGRVYDFSYGPVA